MRTESRNWKIWYAAEDGVYQPYCYIITEGDDIDRIIAYAVNPGGEQHSQFKKAWRSARAFVENPDGPRPPLLTDLRQTAVPAAGRLPDRPPEIPAILYSLHCWPCDDLGDPTLHSTEVAVHPCPLDLNRLRRMATQFCRLRHGDKIDHGATILELSVWDGDGTSYPEQLAILGRPNPEEQKEYIAELNARKPDPDGPPVK